LFVPCASRGYDILRDLKRIHSLICSVAYPILEAAGELQPSRLKAVDADAAQAVKDRPFSG
jgi:phosphate:Na+ symporter